MSTDPTQPKSDSGSGSADQPGSYGKEPETVGRPVMGGPEPVAPTRVQPIQQPQPGGRPEWSAQPSFTPAEPSFTPAGQPAQGAAPGQSAAAGQSAAPAQGAQPGQGMQAGQAGQPGFQQTVWPPADQSGRPGGQAAQGVQGVQAAQDVQGVQAAQDVQPGQWPAQPPQYTPQPGWQEPYYGGGPGGPGGSSGSGGPGGPDGRLGAAGPQGGRLGQPSGRPFRRRRGRRWMMALFTIIVLLILATIGDRVANAIAENDVANQFVKNGFPVKPSVTIEGFPFLTQVLAHDIRQIDISASNVPAGPVDITSIKGTMTGVHLNSSFNGGTVDHIVGTVFVSFSSLASAGNGGTGTGITMSADGPDQVKITAGIGPLSDTEVAKVTQSGNEISVAIVNSGSPLGGLLSSFGSFSFTIPKLPAGLKVTQVSVTSQGIVVSALGTNTQLSEPSS